MTRGRLIWPFTARLESLDTAATAAQDGGQGYDPVFREPIRRADRTTTTTYVPLPDLPCQVETEGAGDPFQMLAQQHHGDDEAVVMALVFHFQDLEDWGLVTAGGKATIKKGDRLVEILDRDGDILDEYAGLDLVVKEAQPRSYGLSSFRRNLLLVTFMRRSRGKTL